MPPPPLSAPAGHTAPRRTARRSSAPTPADQLSPHLAGLAQPALTGLAAAAWTILLATLLPLHAAHRDDALAARRGRPRQIAPGSGAARDSPSPTDCSPPSCTTASACPRPPSPP